MHRIGPRARAVGELEAVADDRHRRMVPVERMVEGCAHFARRQRADLEVAQSTRFLLDQRHRHLDHTAMAQRCDLRGGEVDRARPRMLAAIVAGVIDEAELGKGAKRIRIGAIRSRAKRDRMRRAGRDKQLGRPANQRALFGQAIFDEFESRGAYALVACHSGGPVRMQMELHLLPGRQNRFHNRPDGREAKGQRRHRIDEEACLQPMPREHLKLIRHPDARRFQRTRENLRPGQAIAVMAPHQFRIDGQENGRSHPVGT